MFEYDICRCGNAEMCPLKDQCKRAMPVPPGIYTSSLFYKEGKECEYFWKIKDAEVQSKGELG